MANRTTPQQSAGSSAQAISHEKIAQRAYEKWCKRGCPQGSDQQDWHEAEAELRSEMNRTGGMGSSSQGAQPMGRAGTNDTMGRAGASSPPRR